jgi:RHS repeat-associated protein
MSEVLSYDVMGNIKSLGRDGGPVRAYNYIGQQLYSIDGVTGAYIYDDNGNAKTDGRLGTTVDYNYLNLPISFTNSGLSVGYTYDAMGKKLRKVSSTTGTTDYVDGIVYKPNGSIDFIQTEEGRALNNGGTYSYQYNLSDHLGNVRYSFDIYSGAVRRLQEDDFYAFGLRKSAGSPVSLDNKYLYNGKELQDELEQYDYGARFYDPVVGRWNVVDPLAEDYDDVSPYNYVLNNPITLIDPDGMSADSVKKAVQLKEVVIRPRTKFNGSITMPLPRTVPSIRITPLPPPHPLIILLALLILPTNFSSYQNGLRPGDLSDYQKRRINSASAEQTLTEGKTKIGSTGGKKGQSGNKEKTEQWEGDGGQAQADADFDKVAVPGTVKPIPGGRTARTADGHTVTVTGHSSSKTANGQDRPTIRLHDPRTKTTPVKIRYNP